MVCGVLINSPDLEGTRDDIRSIVESERWHTTDELRTSEGRGKARELLAYCKEVGDCHIFAFKRDLTAINGDTDAAMIEARKMCLTELFLAAQSSHPGLRLIVVEKRQTNTQNDADRSLARELRSSGALSRHTQLFLVSPAEEQLLWLPDLSALTLRRSRTHTDETSKYFETYLRPIALVREVGAGSSDPAGQQLDGT